MYLNIKFISTTFISRLLGFALFSTNLQTTKHAKPKIVDYS